MTRNKCKASFSEVGGYFGLDLPDYGDLYTDAVKFQSGRSAMQAVLECNGIDRVMMPSYICDSIIKSAADAGVEVELYDLDESLYPKKLPLELSSGCVFLYVNYFGLCQQNVFRLLEVLPSNQLVVDNSHALFATSTQALASVYSPRKFAGLPDGGMLIASPSLKITPPMEEDQGSFGRMRHLLTRMAYSAQEGYADFDAARNSLKEQPVLAMSRLTQRLMRGIRWDQVNERRRKNYIVMAQLMDANNDMHWTLGDKDVPLCYPLMIKGRDMSEIKKELIALNVFTATYWPDVIPRVKLNTIESSLVFETLFLPIDQRLEAWQVEEIAMLVLKLVGKSTS